MSKLTDRIIPDNSKKLEYSHMGVTIYCHTSTKGIPCAIAYEGKKKKSTFHFSFQNTKQRKTYLKEYIKEQQVKYDKTQREIQKRVEFISNLEENAIFYSSWGYDQTNIDFYQLTKVTKETIRLRKIESEVIKQGDMRANVIPKKDAFIISEKEISRKVTAFCSVKISSYQYASLWDGKPKTTTSYA